MGKISKTIAIFLTLTIAMSCLTLLTAKPTNAQTISQPSVPEFTVKVIDYSYDVPATYSIDKFTGQTITHEGYHVDNQSVTVIVKNQPFTPYKNNITYHLCYNLQTKGHFEEGNWRYLVEPQDFITTLYYPEQSTGSNTVISFKSSYPANAQIDIQVEAIIFHEGQGIVFEHLGTVHELVNGFVFDQASDWSNRQYACQKIP
jgi:hypothetical protein